MTPIAPHTAPSHLSTALPVCRWPWRPDQGNGTYRNPVICADYSDPDVVRHGDSFYMTASSFNCTPGLPILHSHDLIHWTLVNHAVPTLPGSRFNEVQPGCGIWAPSIRHHAGRFWIVFPMPDEGLYVTTAEDPRGEWTPPHLLQAGKGLIDPCPLWDDNGNAYLVHAYAGSRAGIKHRLRVVPMAPDAEHLIGDGKVVFHNPARHPTLEGPKFLKRDGWYYILAPAGGVATGWQVALRSRNIFGPYEDKIVLRQGSTPVNGPHQGALVDTPDGEWWFVHFQDAGVYGRIVHLQPVEWRDGWPLMGSLREGQDWGEPVLEHTHPALRADHSTTTPATSDEFDAPTLGLQWQWQANHRSDWYTLKTRPGWLRLKACPTASRLPNLHRLPNALLQKFPARVFAVETHLDLSSLSEASEAGLAVVGRESASIAVQRTGSQLQVVRRQSNQIHTLQTLSTDHVRLRVQVQDGGLCQFSFANGYGELITVPQTFQAQPGVWIGAKVGLYACCPDHGTATSHADFEYFRFDPGTSCA